MRLGLTLGYSGAQMQLDVERIREAERLGYHIVWTAESYGSDAATPLAWLGALTGRIKLGTGIMQIPARSPANTAMTAMTLDQLSGGRMVLGLGMSGPQVVEGWHGVAYGKPLLRTREYVAICRAIFAASLRANVDSIVDSIDNSAFDSALGGAFHAVFLWTDQSSIIHDPLFVQVFCFVDA